MTPHDLIANFELLAEAPDGIARLRELVLELAVRGKLVPQDPNDEPASVLLERIAAEKARLVKEGKIPKPKPLAPVGEEEEPFGVPEGWVWCRLSDVFLKITDGTHHSPPNGSEGAFKYITAKNIKSDGISIEDVTFITREVHETIFSRCNPEAGDILYIKDGATTGVVTVNTLDEPFSMLSSVCLLKTPQEIDAWYACFSLRSDFFLSQMRDQMSGTGIPRVTLTKLNEAVFPIPPLPEQHRIVAKVNALMVLLDHVEAARVQREKIRAALRDAALAALRDAPDTEAVEAAWTRIAEDMDDLFAEPADVVPLRKTILQLAVRGKLVPQDPNNEPASILLKRIAAEKALLVKKGKLPKPKPLSSVGEMEKPHELPNGWTWCRFIDVGELARGKSKHRPRNDPALYIGGTMAMVQTGDVARAAGIINTYTALYNDIGVAQSRVWPAGTLCITIAANIADSALLGFDACFPDSVVGFLPFAPLKDARYFEFGSRWIPGSYVSKSSNRDPNNALPRRLTL